MQGVLFFLSIPRGLIFATLLKSTMILKMRGFFPLVLMAFSITALAQDDRVVLTVDGQDVTVSEFEAIYKKNNKDADVTKEALDEYMELFVNYKLKVREAESLGMDTIKKFQRELAGYRGQLARPYLIDRRLNETLLKEAYERRQNEVRASHILVSIGGEQLPSDTLVAWNRIQKLRERVTTGGEDFSGVAKSPGGSDDPSAKNNAGDLFVPTDYLVSLHYSHSTMSFFENALWHWLRPGRQRAAPWLHLR